MKIEHLGIGDLRPNPWNPNRMTARERAATRESLELFGWLVPLVVREHPDEDFAQILDGEHRWIEARALGHPEVPCIVLEGLDADEAKKISLVLGEIKGESEPERLGKIVAELAGLTDFEKGLPYTPQELDALIAYGPEALDGAGEEPEDEWRTLSAQVPKSFLAVYQACEDRLAAALVQEGKALHPKRAVRRGQVLEVLAASYLAGK